MASNEQMVSVTRQVPAPPHEIFDLLTDPKRHPVLDGSGSVVSARGNPERLRLGSKFGMDMKMGPVPYRVVNQVVEFEANRLVAWCHFMKHRWRWELAAGPDGCTEVTGTFDWSTALVPAVLEKLGFPDKNRQALEATLDRLVDHFGASDRS